MNGPNLHGGAYRFDGVPDPFEYSYSLQHCGFIDLADAAVINTAGKPAESAAVEVSWTNFARPHIVKIPRLADGERFRVGNAILPVLDHEQLRDLDERETVEWHVRLRDTLLHKSKVDVFAHNEWAWKRPHEASLAAFVQPGVDPITQVIAEARNYLEKHTNCSTHQEALCRGHAELEERGAADSVSETWDGMAESVYDALRMGCDWAYEHEPPSFEFASQKVRLPGQMWRTREGTCIDLSLAYASCLERVGLRPVVVILRNGNYQHALAGYFRNCRSSFGVVLRCKKQLDQLATNDLRFVECTGFARGKGGSKASEKTEFRSACRNAARTLESWDLSSAVDVCAARDELAITPLPTRGGRGCLSDGELPSFFEVHEWPRLPGADGYARIGWLGGKAASTLARAIRYAVWTGAGVLSTRHVLLALLANREGVTEMATRLLHANEAILRGNLLRRIWRGAPGRPRAVRPTSAVSDMMRTLWDDGAFTKTGSLVSEAMLIRGAVGSDSKTIRRFLKEVRCTRADFLRALDTVESSPSFSTDASSVESLIQTDGPTDE